MPDYGKSKIYKLISLVSNEIYIGSTTRPLSLRKGSHISSYKAWLLNKEKYKVCCSYKLIEKGDIDIILIENHPCNSKEELHARERYHIENNDCINIRLPIKTKEEIREMKRKYWEDNYDYLYGLIKKDKIENPEKYKQFYKNKYQLSKDKRFVCDCGSDIKLNNKYEHFQSNKHKKYINSSKRNI
jgi:hypothetical protein